MATTNTPIFDAQPEARKLRDIVLPTAVLDVTPPTGDGALYAACHDGVYRVDPESGTHERIGGHASYASGVVVDEDAGRLISAGYDGALNWYDTTSGEQLRTVAAHSFWSWQLAMSPDRRLVASTTGQYLCGGYKYEPAPEREPSVKVFAADSGELVRGFTHVPPVESVAFSRDGAHLAAGNLMGEVRVWSIESGELVSAWTTPSFTGWGIIKGHYYTGGVFALEFSPDDERLFAAGMGSTRDPAAGNGRQLWQRFAWRETPARQIDETRRDDSGQGLMETLAHHPSGRFFVMAGRLFKGDWNAALFDATSGERLAALPQTKSRVTRAVFDREGHHLYLAAAVGQGGPKDGKYPHYGRIHVFGLARRSQRF